MNDVAELKQFVTVHARAQRIPRRVYQQLLDRIHNDDDGSPGSWAVEWSRAGAEAERRGELLHACQFYNMARYPYVDGSARRQAAHSLVGAFGQWAARQPDLESLDVAVGGQRVRCWASGLSVSAPRPLGIISGGIVSTKEQWASLLRPARRLGMAGIVMELPGVGENPLRYDIDSWQMLSTILDTVKDRADVSQTYMLAMSFSGHLAFRCALEDPRIKGVVTAGAPVAKFFTDRAWLSKVPRITRDTLAHLTQVNAPADIDHMAAWALTAGQLSALDIPICYMASRHDEIIPNSETRFLLENLPQLRLIENDDVHGSPRHITETRLWCALSMQRIRGISNAQTAALSALLSLVRAARRLAG